MTFGQSPKSNEQRHGFPTPAVWAELTNTSEPESVMVGLQYSYTLQTCMRREVSAATIPAFRRDDIPMSVPNMLLRHPCLAFGEMTIIGLPVTAVVGHLTKPLAPPEIALIQPRLCYWRLHAVFVVEIATLFILACPYLKRSLSAPCARVMFPCMPWSYFPRYNHFHGGDA